jgi:hypothetical protein
MSSSPSSSSASISACDQIAESFRPYLEGSCSPEEAATMLAHLKVCATCKAEFDSRKSVLSLLNQTYGEKRISDGFEVKADRRVAELKNSKRKPAPSAVMKAAQKNVAAESDEVPEEEQEESPRGATATLGAAPWWLVSTAMHVLIIALASLVSMAIELPKSDDAVIMITELQNRPPVEQAQEEAKKAELRDALAQHETPATDLNSKEASDIVVPPDILAKAELGDHFETINPDLPDTHSALGNPDSKSFHSVEGNTEPPGGGGMNGMGMDDLIGVGGAASKGTGGGFGGGDGTGTGVGTGAGHGSFGQRNGGGRKLMVKRHGGSARTENAVDKALEWLAYHQEPDGSWSVMKHEGTGDWDPGVTGLALLAFLGAGHSEKVGTYKDNVKRAVAWIIAHQRADGAIGTDAKYSEHHGGYGYHHAICGMALVEAAGMSRIPETKAAAQKAVDYTCEQYQYGEASEKLAWRYTPKAKEADISVSGWYVMQLKSAKMAGITVNPASFEGALKFLATREADGANVKKEDDGYDTGKHRYGYLDRTPMHNTTAIGSLCQLFLGTKREDVVGSAMWLLRTCPPTWKADCGVGNGGGWPMYYTYYTSLFMFQVGGEQWKQWNEAMKAMLLPNQRKDGDFAGSWDTLSDWEKKCGRCYSTALGALSLEVYYRYLQLGH